MAQSVSSLAVATIIQVVLVLFLSLAPCMNASSTGQQAEPTGRVDQALTLSQPIAEPGSPVDLVVELHRVAEFELSYVTNDEKRLPILEGFARNPNLATVVWGASESATIQISNPFKGEISVALGHGVFQIDEKLNVLPKGQWPGKREGAVHKIVGQVTLFDYVFDSDPADPLTFRVTKEGYRFLQGIGDVLDKESGKTHKLNKPSREAKLYRACQAGDTEVVKRVIAEGLDVNWSPAGGSTPLMIAAERGNSAVAHVLLAHGANVNAQEWKESATALMLAAKNGNAEIVSLLLDHGADPAIKDKDRWTAMRWATARHHKQVEDVLKKAGVNE